MNKYIGQSIALTVSTALFATAVMATNIEKPPVIDRESAVKPSYQSAQEIINSRGFQREAGANDDSAGTRNGYQNNPTRPSTGGTPNSSIAAINCQHAAYKVLCDEIDKKINDAIDLNSGGEQVEPKWNVIYDGAGTNSISVPQTYQNYKIFFSYKANGAPKTHSMSGVHGTSAGVSTSKSASDSCGANGSTGSGKTATATASIYTTVDESFTIGSSRTVTARTGTSSNYCNEGIATATIENLKITRFEAFY
ncbi:hypothetical protein QTV44_002527 [Vibrio vulnificus]|nr:hypothetical protein [Vibrio vulnificus]